ncbi:MULTISPECIES: Xaa-Pro peptidase family protein [unclassified Dehalobacter]|uniref:M24 family metallopeptidase n=1 Tax=unclassified Dehalobacter TaxID=2635733 RepID=UPI000E6C3486|nr:MULTISPECIES: Xaa-Pro peptidase family protein [unclassified Dehalobacter]RJE48588.1 peptidase M24 [Dehalobacter sp. MCB1]TCX46725.1 peptidase M24 [Dehalobacter sp. 14DCB1]TCX51244.1 peptidase M24 [Dehalobacter sp. 12DCB1]
MTLMINELDRRLNHLCGLMDQTCPDWDTILILGKVNQYYFTGTMQDGMLIIQKDRTRRYFVRRSYERAKAESLLTTIYPMESYRDAAGMIGTGLGNTYLETEIVPLAMLQRLKKYFTMTNIHSVDKPVLSVRAVKSPYELEWVEQAGKNHCKLLHELVPPLLREGMSEADFVAELYAAMIKIGHHGVSRFSMFQTEMVAGQIGFGESSLYPTSFDGPGGAYGMCPAVPLLGSRERKLKKGDLVFVDVGFGCNGYHSDKTQVYIFGAKPDADVVKAHRACMEIEQRLAAKLIPGAIPSEIYQSVMSTLSEDFRRNFMGYGERQVKFLGHGVGLHVDELPVITNGFLAELTENMVIALEPKKGLPNIGMVGVEDTYVVSAAGGRCLTGGGTDIIEV